MQFIETKGTFLPSFPVFYIMVRYTDRKKIKECEIVLSCKIYHGTMTISDSEDQYVPFHPGWWKWKMHAKVEKVCCGGTR